MASTPPAKPPRTELDYQLSFKKWDTLSDVIRDLFKWSCLAFLGFMAYRIAGVLAGKNTLADLTVRLLADLKANRGIILLLGGGGWAYGLAQRSLRRKNVQRLVPLKNELERQIDKKRTSSDLTSKGTTPPKKRKG
jgi:hypothetical protein